MFNCGVSTLDPESWYGGFPRNANFEDQSPGNFVPPEFHIKTMISDLLRTFKNSIPIGKRKTKEDWAVYIKGNGIPTYKHEHNGVCWISDLEYDCSNKSMKHKYRHKESKGILISDGSVGLGINYTQAIKLWGQVLVDSLPII